MSPRRRHGWTPQLNHVKARGIGRVRFPGEPDVYLGSSGDWPADQTDPPEAILREYQRLCGDWLRRRAMGESPPSRRLVGERTLTELIAEHLAGVRRAARHKHAGRVTVVRTALGRLAVASGRRTPATYTAADYRRLRDDLAREGLKAVSVRDYLAVIRRFLRAVGVPRSVREDIADMGPPPGGYGAASEPVPPVPDEVLQKVLPHATAKCQAMLRLQRLTGMRPGEVTQLRAGEIDRTADRDAPADGPRCWLYQPRQHKKRHRGHARRVWIGPAAQAILTPWLEGKGPEDIVFPSRTGGGEYGPAGYCAAIHAACERAGVPRFNPNQVRHTTATALELADPRGITAAQGVLGHDSPSMTRRYSAALDQAAREAMRRHG